MITAAVVALLGLSFTACSIPLDAHGGRSGYPGSRSSRVDRLAYDNGYRDGYNQGRDDARDRDRYDPRGTRLYRTADRGYDRRWGSWNEYRDHYRDGFLSGYETGYRNGRGRDRGRDRDNRRDRRRP